MLLIACEYGWEPADTQLPSGEEWWGGYGTSDGQVITSADATHLADALDLAVSDDGLEEVAARLEAETRQALAQKPGQEAANAYSGGLGDPQEARATLSALAEFCRVGVVWIE